jgi:hypothetical protein
MKNPIPVNLVVEDSLSEAVLLNIIRQSSHPYAVGAIYGKLGNGYIKKNIEGFNNAAKGTPFLVLTDLDNVHCAPTLVEQWLPAPRHKNLLFRVAVREVESWLLAHRKAFAGFLGIKEELIPQDVDGIIDPKNFLIGLASKCSKSELKRSIVPPIGSTRKQGPDYNGRLIHFVESAWQASVAKNNSASLDRTIQAITKFQPFWSQMAD